MNTGRRWGRRTPISTTLAEVKEEASEVKEEASSFTSISLTLNESKIESPPPLT